MATSVEYIENLCALLQGIGEIRYRKMFGEYLVYLNDKPVLTVCDNTPYVKKLDCIAEQMQSAETGYPYAGAKEHYILDFGNPEFCKSILLAVEAVTPLPKRKSPKQK